MPKAFPLEFRSDVVAVARKREAPLSRITKDLPGELLDDGEALILK